MAQTQEQKEENKYESVQFIGYSLQTTSKSSYVKETEKKTNEAEDKYKQTLELTEDIAKLIQKDIDERIELVKHVINEARSSSDESKKVLKVFMLPEFFFRGPYGAYPLSSKEPIAIRKSSDENNKNYYEYEPFDKQGKHELLYKRYVLYEKLDEKENLPKNEGKKLVYCVDYIREKLEKLVNKEQWEHWIFIFGTIVAYWDFEQEQQGKWIQNIKQKEKKKTKEIKEIVKEIEQKHNKIEYYVDYCKEFENNLKEIKWIKNTDKSSETLSETLVQKDFKYRTLEMKEDPYYKVYKKVTNGLNLSLLFNRYFVKDYLDFKKTLLDEFKKIIKSKPNIKTIQILNFSLIKQGGYEVGKKLHIVTKKYIASGDFIAAKSKGVGKDVVLYVPIQYDKNFQYFDEIPYEVSQVKDIVDILSKYKKEESEQFREREDDGQLLSAEQLADKIVEKFKESRRKVKESRKDLLSDEEGLIFKDSTGQVTFGLEICLDHVKGRLQDLWLNYVSKPLIDIHLVVAASAALNEDKIVAAENGYLFSCQGRGEITHIGNKDGLPDIFTRQCKTGQEKILQPVVSELKQYAQSLKKQDLPISSIKKIQEEVKEIFFDDSGWLKIYQAHPLDTKKDGKASFALSLSTELPEVPLFLNGQSVLFDRAVSTTPVAVQPKAHSSRVSAWGGGDRNRR